MGEMQKWVVLGWALLALVCAHDCPNGGHCENGRTCCSSPENGYDCCPFHQAECCEDHIHCCPEGTLCNVQESGCVNATVSFPWAKRVSSGPLRLSKSFRMIRPYLGDDDELVSAVMCSDGKSECPEENTCCEAPDGSWGCCPMPKAVCCEDKTHCCPKGSTCDVKQLKCISLSTNKAMPMWAKLPARKRADWENQKEGAQVTAQVMRGNEVTTSPVTEEAEHVLTMLREGEKACNVSCDSTTSCPDKTTCCKTAEGVWACCNLPQAVCCKDHVHCCPHGTTCDVATQTCKGPSGSVPAVKKVPAYTTVAPRSQSTYRDNEKAFNVSCDSTASCPDKTTCCKTAAGAWACCNLPQAVCCKDHLSCCPHGTTCDVATQSCNGPSESVPAVKKVPAYTTVAPSSQSTYRDNEKALNVSCDSTAYCPDKTTCCKTAAGAWVCCNLPQLKAYTTVAPSSQGTTQGTENVTTTYNEKAFNVTCDSTTACPDKTTCCKTVEGGWACCDLPEAVCCKDHVHCCPHGTTCDVATQSCNGPSESVPAVKKVPAYTTVAPSSQSTYRDNEKAFNVSCDSTASCPDKTTCCKTAAGAWACCNLPQAVCCKDHLSCCPHGTTCDVATHSCNGPSESVPAVKKVPAYTTVAPSSQSTYRDNEKAFNVSCDSTASCPDKTTCCKTAAGAWACCNLPQAVCCEDHLSCCPHGTTCDVATQSCNGPSESVPAVKKVPAYTTVAPSSQSTYRDNEKAFNVSCDSTASCPDKTTCCKTAAGAWACCNLPQAVCCKDHLSCCPHGTTCDVATHSCNGPSESVPAVKKVPAYTTVAPSSQSTYRDNEKAFNVSCDSTASCPDKTTCCKTAAGAWACCDLPQAVCCKDHLSCCPHGTTCDVATQSCNGPSESVPAVKTWPAYTTVGPSSQGTTQGTENVPATYRDDVKACNVSCDSTTSCPDKTTCCKTAEGKWACCEIPEAVCCEDHIHCCPHGYTCDLASQKCNGPSDSLPIVKKVPAYTTVAPSTVEATTQELAEEEEEEEEGAEDGIPCDRHTSCPKYTTCCFIDKYKKWGCCPVPEAVCCKNGDHCCPKSYSCDPDKTACRKGEVVIPWYNKLPATNSQLLTPNSVECDVQNTCPEHSTCCRLSTGQWGCCPLHKAVCCPDMEHCCPQGYSCNLGSASCLKVTILQLQRVPSTRVSGLPSLAQPKTQPKLYDLGRVVQCEGGTCKDGETCCRTSTTTWGCCPSPNAVCCSDMKNCCPAGHTCNKDGTCSQNTELSWDNWQQFFFNKKRALLL